MSRLRIVKPDDPENGVEAWMADQARAALEALLKKPLVTLFLVYEEPDTRAGVVSFPASPGALRGVLEDALDGLLMGEEE